MSRTVKIDFTGITSGKKEQAHSHELAQSVPAKADIVLENLDIVKREFPANGWVNWGIEPDNLKKPFTPATLYAAAPGRPNTWGTLSEAIRNVEEGKAQGIGFNLDNSGIYCIDLDHVIDSETKEIHPEALDIIAELDTYTEVSMSGTGFHLFVRADTKITKTRKTLSVNGMKPQEGNAPGIEVYCKGRYIIVTGNIFDGRSTINERAEALSSVYNKYFPETKPPAPQTKELSSTKKHHRGTAKNEEIERAIERKAAEYKERMLKNEKFNKAANGEYLDRSDNPYYFGNCYAYWMLPRLGAWSETDVEEAFQLFKTYPVFKRYSDNDDKLNRNGEYLSTIHRSITDGFRSQTENARDEDRANPKALLKTYGDEATKQKEALSAYPDIITLKNGTVRPAETLANFKVCLAKYGIKVGYNCLSHEIIAPKSFREQYSPVARQAALLSYCQDLCALEQIPKTPSRVAGWLSTVADENKVHPVQWYLEKLPPASGTAEIKHLFSCLELAEAAPKRFSFILVKRWLVQCVAMAYNSEGDYGADGVLVLQGAQGIGKTSFFRALCKPLKGYFKEGAEQNSDKDKLIENTKYWITELGELERSTMKEMGALKAFITNSADEYRAPYGVSSVKYPRYTSFCGTVNEADFLKEAGRRWWIIPLVDIDLDELKTVDISQVWAEAYALWRADHNAFRLSKEESQEVERFSGNFERKTVEEQTILDRMDFEADSSEWGWKSASDIARQLSLPDPVKVGKALRKIIYGGGRHLKRKAPKNKVVYFVPPYNMPDYQ